MSLKAKGSLAGVFDIAPAGGLAQLSSFQDQAANRQRYALFRGWVHAAAHALASEAAGQEVKIGRMKGKKAKDKNKPKGTKTQYTYKMPEQIRSKAAKQELEVLEDHELLDCLEKPNLVQHRWQFVYSFVANLCLTGWAFVIGGKGKEGKPEFYSIPTTWVTPDHTKGLFAEFHIQNPRNPAAQTSKPLTRDQVAFAYLPNPIDPLAALSPAQAQSLAIKIDDNIQSSQELFFDNAVFPSAIVTIGKNPHPDAPGGGVRPRLTPAQRRQVYGAIRKVMSGVANYGNPAIIDGMIESIEKLSATQNEIGWEKSEKSVRTRILSAFGVHPFILGEEMAGSYAQAYIVQDRFAKRVNIFLSLLSIVMTQFAPLFVEQEKEDLLIWWEECKPSDPSMEKSLWEAARGRGDISQNEFRAWMGLPPDEDKSEAEIEKSSVSAVTDIAAKATKGELAPEQAQAILVAMGLPEETAVKIAGEGPPEQPEGEEGMEEDWGAEEDFGSEEDWMEEEDTGEFDVGSGDEDVDSLEGTLTELEESAKSLQVSSSQIAKDIITKSQVIGFDE